MFEALDNFRDFGGYPARDGRRLATGRLFRSAHHADVTEADLQRLKDLGIAVFVDLRRTDERARQPSRRPPGFDGLIIENDIAGDEPDAWLAFIRDTKPLDADAFRGHMRDFYRDGAHEPRHVDLYTRYFDALARTDGAVLIHCAAGKDRTGILAALTQHLAGVPDAQITHEYLLTNNEAALQRRIPGITGYIAKHTGLQLSPEMVRAGIWIEAEFIQTTFAELARRHGSVDGYLEDVLGVDAAKRDAILGRLLV